MALLSRYCNEFALSGCDGLVVKDDRQIQDSLFLKYHSKYSGTNNLFNMITSIIIIHMSVYTDCYIYSLALPA
jgi:hypothetical protein